MFGWFKKKKKKQKAVQETPVVKNEVVEETPVVEEEPLVEEAPVVEEEPVAKEEPKVEKEPEEEKAPKPAKKQPYHITKHPDGGWQIKRGKAKKAHKRFETQKEAIEYAKVLEKEKGESYIIHKADGTTRKKTY